MASPPQLTCAGRVECELRPWRPIPHRRLPDTVTVVKRVAAWERQRTLDGCAVRWHFTTAQARRKLASPTHPGVTMVVH